MKKRLIGTLLLGALFVSSTSVFVSCKDYDDDINSLSASIQKLESQVAQKEATVTQAINDLKGITNDLKAKDVELAGVDAALQKAIQDLQNAHDKDVADLKAKDVELDKAIIKAQAAAEAASALAQSLHDENAQAIAKVAGDLATTNSRVATLQTSLEETSTKLDNVALNLATAEKNIGNLQDSMKTAYQRIATLDAALVAQKAELEQKIADLNTAMTNKDNELDGKITNLATALNNKAEELNGKITANSNKIAEIVNTTIPQLRQELAAAESRLATSISEANSRIDAAESSINGLQQDINRIDEKLNVIDQILSGDLRSLVFKPYAYVDGIEAIMYPYFSIEHYLWNNEIASPKETFQRGVRYGETQDAQQTTPNEGAKLTIPAGTDYVVNTGTHPADYWPEIGVDYHMNPATAQTKWEDLLGFAQRDTRYTETTTRASANDLIVLAAKNQKTGYQFFANKDGELSVGLKVTDPDKLLAMENYIVALQAKAGTKEAVITSDYAEVYPEHITKPSIAWAKDNDRIDAGGNAPVDLDEKCNGIFADNDPYHKVSNHANHMVFDTPKEALLASASVFVPYNDPAGVSLRSYLMTCFDREGHQGGDKYHAAMPLKNKVEERYGFRYTFEIVPYIHEKNLNDGTGANTGAIVMKDDQYAHFIAGTDTIVANAMGEFSKAATETAIGREPLVRVLLWHGDQVVQDGYILCRIYSEHSDSIVNVEKYADWTKDYDNCHGLEFKTPSPSKLGDFDKLIIKDLLNSEFDFLTFNGLYDLDGGLANATIYTSNQEPNGANPALYQYTDRNGNKQPIAKIALTKVKDVNNKEYSYAFTITMTADQVEAITHDQNSASITPSLYIRWTAKNVRAPYKHIYMKLQVTINRSIQISGVKEKLDNYWYGLNGASTGWDALAFNVKYPEDNTDTKNWTNYTRRAFVGNQEDFTLAALTNGEKYFFIPQNTEITDLEGTTWVITPAAGDTDVKWMTLYDHKNIQDTHIWPLTSAANATYRLLNAASATDLATLKNMMTWCNFDYQQGVFTNNKLYAVKKSEYHNNIAPYSKVYTQIAELNQTTGQVTLSRTWTGDNNKCADNNPLDMVLNAIGYAANHANMTSQFHAWMGLAAENGCNVAVYSFDDTTKENNQEFGIWTASYERPINLVNDKPKDEYDAVKDAQSNGYFIPIYDLLAFYDWRGPVEGDMEKTSTKWLWAYYNINRIEADLDPTHVTTTLHGGTLGKINVPGDGTTLASLSGEVRLYPATAAQRSAVKAPVAYTFNTLIGTASASYNSASVSSDLVNYLEGVQNGKANFGYIFYENNGVNVEEFIVRIPLNIYYEWGHFRTYVDVKINTTLGN